MARDLEASILCGYIAALSDGVACAYISALEVRQEYRGKGIGTELLNRMVERLNVFAVYLSCAPSMTPFYEAAGFSAGTSMSKRLPLSAGNDA
ncbi:MAG: GNAT family N-acetyltransferase [Betaproteobacteria bacterium]|nr:GNAT family N-acetyltransferase [Betaproteobacteria bacterium]